MEKLNNMLIILSHVIVPDVCIAYFEINLQLKNKFYTSIGSVLLDPKVRVKA